MITFFTIPRAFDDERVRHVQDVAITSWRMTAPDAEVMLFGDEAGIESYAQAAGLRSMGPAPTTRLGTPLLDHVFSTAEGFARHDTLCYVNCDLVLTPELIRAVRRIRFPRYLLSGRRFGIDWVERESLDHADWEATLKHQAVARGEKGGAASLDYFVFRRHTLGSLPPFAVGRPGWDNWMIYNARRRGIPVVDASRAILAVHQEHDHLHVPSPRIRGSSMGPEADRNMELVGEGSGFDLTDATHSLAPRFLLPYLTLNHRVLYRRLSHVEILHPRVRPVMWPIMTPLRWVKTKLYPG